MIIPIYDNNLIYLLRALVSVSSGEENQVLSERELPLANKNGFRKKWSPNPSPICSGAFVPMHKLKR